MRPTAAAALLCVPLAAPPRCAPPIADVKRLLGPLAATTNVEGAKKAQNLLGLVTLDTC